MALSSARRRLASVNGSSYVDQVWPQRLQERLRLTNWRSRVSVSCTVPMPAHRGVGHLTTDRPLNRLRIDFEISVAGAGGYDIADVLVLRRIAN